VLDSWWQPASRSSPCSAAALSRQLLFFFFFLFDRQNLLEQVFAILKFMEKCVFL